MEDQQNRKEQTRPCLNGRAGFHIIKDTALDITTPRLYVACFDKFVIPELQILAYVAETERAFIKQRQAEGIAAAKLKGVQFGCKRTELHDKFEEYYQLFFE